MSARMTFSGLAAFATTALRDAWIERVTGAPKALIDRGALALTSHTVELRIELTAPARMYHATLSALYDAAELARDGTIRAGYEDEIEHVGAHGRRRAAAAAGSGHATGWPEQRVQLLAEAEVLVLYALDRERDEPAPPATPAWIAGADAPLAEALLADRAPHLTTLPVAHTLARLARAGAGDAIAWVLATARPFYAWQLEPPALAGDGTARERGFAVERDDDDGDDDGDGDRTPPPRVWQIDPKARRCLKCGSTAVEVRSDDFGIEAWCTRCDTYDSWTARDEVAETDEPPPPGALDGFVRIPAGRFVLGLQGDEAERLAAEAITATRRKDRRIYASHNPWQRGGGLMGEDWDPERAREELRDQLAAASPPIEVELEAFEISRLPVTNAEYQRFVDATGAAEPASWPYDDPGLPVTGISHADAVAFARWARVELPTDAQWERAARGAERRLFPWDDTFAAVGDWLVDQDTTRPWRPADHPELASPDGCLDLVTLRGEWCRDRELADRMEHDDRHRAAIAALMFPYEGGGAVVRGGAPNLPMVPSALLRTRRAADERSRTYPVGFRLVRRA